MTSLLKKIQKFNPVDQLSKGLRNPLGGGGGSMPSMNAESMLNTDKQNALFNFGLNNNKTNVFGSQNTVSDGNGGWMLKQTYAEPIQKAIEGNLSLMPGVQQRVAETLSHKAFDPTDPAKRQEIMDAMLSRMNFGADEESLRTRLANQGLTEGSEAWTKEMNTFNQGKNDARMQALLNSGTEMANLFNLDQAGRMAPINELSALGQASQGIAPDFGFTAYTTPLTNPEVLKYQAAMDKYNAGQAQKNNLMGGLFQLGSAAIMASDRRLKSNIVRVGTHPLGVGIYDYDIAGRRERGVMAQEVLEVKPEAVHQHPAGYLMVDYGAL